MRPALAFALATACCGTLAQDFPVGAAAPAAPDLQQRLAGRVYDVKLANGSGWRLEYQANGYVFLNTSQGYSDSGKWRVEDGKLCHELRKSNPSCSEVRALSPASFLLRRDSGEIVEFVPRP